MSAKYIARVEGNEGKILYDDNLTSPDNLSTYFPKRAGESAMEYALRPKISVPITPSIINRIVNILNFQTSITTDNEEVQEVLNILLEDLNLIEYFRDISVNTLVTGNNLSVIRLNEENQTSVENWDGRFVWQDNKSKLQGYEYTIVEDLMVPVYSDEVKEEDRTIIVIDERVFGATAHNLPFNPSTLSRNIDKYDDRRWGKSFIMRFDVMALEFNDIASQISKSIKILQNVFISNRETDNPERPLRLAPDRINFVGDGGTLEMLVRNLDLSEERNYLEILEGQISRASQVPSELSGLRLVGKLPSGIALALMLMPLTELLGRFRSLFEKTIIEVMNKVISIDYLKQGKSVPEYELIVEQNENIFPEDRGDKIDEIILLHKEGLLPIEQEKQLLEPILDIELTQIEEPVATVSGILEVANG